MTTTNEVLIHPSHAINRLRVVTRLARCAVGAGLTVTDLDDISVRHALVRITFPDPDVHKRFDPETWTWVQVMVKELTA